MYTWPKLSPRPQVHPRAEDLTGRDADVLVPWLRVDAARHALRRVEADVVLHRTEIRQAQRGHLRTLPVLLEPATIVTMHRQVEHQQARDVRLLDLQVLLEFERHTFPTFHLQNRFATLLCSVQD